MPKREDNIKMHLKEIAWFVFDWLIIEMTAARFTVKPHAPRFVLNIST